MTEITYEAASRDISDRLEAARREPSRTRTKQLLREAAEIAAEQFAALGDPSLLAWRFHALAFLALEQDTAADRCQLWTDSLNKLRSMIGKHPGATLPIAFANMAVDCFQDTLSDMPFNRKVGYLRDSLKGLDSVALPDTDAHFPDILCRKSSVLRHLAFADVLPEDRRRRLEQALRCANMAINLSETPDSLLEAGLSEWAVAQSEKAEGTYKRRCDIIEERLARASALGFELATLSLARFFRMTYQPLRACDVYVEVAIHDDQVWLAWAGG